MATTTTTNNNNNVDDDEAERRRTKRDSDGVTRADGHCFFSFYVAGAYSNLDTRRRVLPWLCTMMHDDDDDDGGGSRLR